MTHFRAIRSKRRPFSGAPCQRWWRGGVFASAVLLAACAATVEPAPPPPETGPAYKETGLWSSATSPAPAVTPEWWKALGDPLLDDLQRQLLTQPPRRS